MKALLLVSLLTAAPNVTDDRLTQSACNGDLARVRRFIREGDAPTEKSLFCASATSFNTEMTDLLLAHGADANWAYAYQNPLTGYDFDMTMLQYAVQTGRLEIASVLLNRGANVNLRYQAVAISAIPYATTALGLAAASGKSAAVRFLLSRNADPNADHAAALFAVASRPGMEQGQEILRDLIAAGGDPATRNAEGRTVCEVASGASLSALQAAGGCP